MKKPLTTHKKSPAPSRKRAAAKKAHGPTASAAKRTAVPSGYTKSGTGRLLIPEARAKSADPGVVPASKLQKGISKAREQISGVLQELLEATRDGYEVTEIELSASFNADGKFLGFGVGGEMSITFKVRPTDEA